MAGDVKIPEWREPAIDVPVQDLREFVAKYGPNVAVLTTWVRKHGIYQFVTIGSSRSYSDSAVNLRNIIAGALRLNPLDPTKEDLRDDHPNVNLTREQIDFLLWLLGYIHAATKDMDAGHKEYIMKHHGKLLPIFGDAKEKIVNKPV